MSVERGIHFEVVWVDDYLFEVRVRASNGHFAGVADCYADRRVFADLADAIRGFPAATDDRREFVMGTLAPGYAGGGARLSLRCIDRSLHAVADVLLQSDTSDRRASASFTFPVEAAAIDVFVAELGRAVAAVGAAASLHAAK